MAAVINNLVNESVVDKELDSLIARLATIEKNLDAINGKAISVKFEGGGTASITELTELIKKQDELIKKLTQTQKEHADTSDKLAQKVLANELKKIEAREKATDKAIAAMQKEQAQRAAAIEKEQQASDKLAQKTLANELKKAEAADLYVRKIQEKADKLQKAAEKEAANLAKSQEAYALLSKEYNEAARAAQNLGAQQFRLNQDVKNGVNVAFNTSKMAEMAPALAMAKDKANGLHKALLEIDQTVGRSQRNVGNYTSATHAMSQVLREAPSFAYSFAQGLLGISNNIPILVDEITRLKTANIELQAQGKATVPIWKQLAAAFTSPVGIITTLTAVVTIFAARMSMASNETKKAADAMSEYEEKLKSVAKANDALRADITAEAKFDLSKAKSEVDIMKDKNLTLDQRFLAYKRLMSIAPNIFDELDKEGFKTAENTKRMDEQIASMNRYIQLQAEISKGRANQQNILKSIEANEDAQAKKRADIEEERQKLLQGTPGRRVAVRPERVDQFIKDVGNRTSVGKGAEDISVMQAELNKLAQERTILENLSKGYDTVLAKKEQMRAALQGDTRNPKEKEKHPERDAKKEMEAEIRKEEAIYEAHKLSNQRFYDLGNKTFHEERILQENQRQAAMVHAEKMLAIVEKYHGKVGEKEEAYKARQIQIANDKMAVDNAVNEKERAIAEEIQKRHDEEAKRIDEYIDNLAKQRAELMKLQIELENIQEKSKINSESLDGAAPIWAALGFNPTFDADIKKRLADIKKIREEIANIEEQRSNEIGKPNASLQTINTFNIDIKKKETDIAKLEAENQAAIDKRMFDAKKALAEKTIELAKETVNAIMEIERQKFRDEEAGLNRQSQQIKDNYDEKVRAINAEAGYQEDKALKIQELNAQTQAQENKLTEEKKQLAIRQARFEKSAAEASVIAKGAVGVAEIWSKWAAVPVVAAALTAVQLGIIAAQLATIQSAPVPAYKEGTPEGGHKGGLAVIGDGGAPEYVTTPTGKSFWSKPTATLVDLPKGSTVTPLHKMATNLVGANPNYSISDGEATRFMEYKNMTDKLTKTFEDGVENIVDSVIMSRANIVINQRDRNFEVSRLKKY